LASHGTTAELQEALTVLRAKTRLAEQLTAAGITDTPVPLS
jgi:hypothetical protein